MKQVLKVAMSFDEYTTGKVVTKVITLSFHDEIIQPWCLELCLLEKGLVDTATLVAETGSFKLDIAKDTDLSPSDRGKVEWHSRGAKAYLSINELEVWAHFYLKYHLNGISDVDHIDTELRANEPNPALALVLKVPSYFPPVTAEEARRRLGLS